MLLKWSNVLFCVGFSIGAAVIGPLWPIMAGSLLWYGYFELAAASYIAASVVGGLSVGLGLNVLLNLVNLCAVGASKLFKHCCHADYDDDTVFGYDGDHPMCPLPDWEDVRQRLVSSWESATEWCSDSYEATKEKTSHACGCLFSCCTKQPTYEYETGAQRVAATRKLKPTS